MFVGTIKSMKKRKNESEVVLLHENFSQKRYSKF